MKSELNINYVREKQKAIRNLAKKYSVDIENINVNLDLYLDEEHKLLESKILESNNAEDMYLFAHYVGGAADIETLSLAILRTNDVEYIYKFAIEFSGRINVLNFEDKVVEGQNIEYVYLFAKNVRDASIEYLESEIIESNNFYYMYLFARDVKGANILKLKNAALISKNEKLISCFDKLAVKRGIIEDYSKYENITCEEATEEFIIPEKLDAKPSELVDDFISEEAIAEEIESSIIYDAEVRGKHARREIEFSKMHASLDTLLVEEETKNKEYYRGIDFRTTGC